MKDHPSQWTISDLTCREIADATTDFLESRLSTAIKVKVDVHLVSCHGCRAYVEQMALVREALLQLPQELPPSMIQSRLHEHFVATYLQ